MENDSRINSNFSYYIDLIVGCLGLITGLIIYFIIIPATIIIPPGSGVKAPVYISIQFIPKLWTLIWIACSLFLLVQTLYSKKISLKEVKEILEFKATEMRESSLSIIVFLGIMVFYIIMLPILGFILNSTLFLIFSKCSVNPPSTSQN